MDRDERYMQGYRHAAKEAVTWLQERAAEMNDDHAKVILNSAAFNMGSEFGRKSKITRRPTIVPDEVG